MSGSLSSTLLAALICLAPTSELKAQSAQPVATAKSASANVVLRASGQQTKRNGKIQPVAQQMLGPTGIGYPHVERPRTIRDFSWIYIEEPELEEIRQHDIITILVDKKYQDRVNSNFNRTRTSTFKAELKEFLRISEDGNLTNAAENQPTIDTNLQGKLNSTGATSNQEGIQYRIAAIVVEVLPNGNLVLEARDRIEINGDVFVYTLTGILPSDKVAANMTATSENIYNLDVSKDMKGKVSDSVKRPWGVWLYDKFSPF
ncbi:Flagellar L-ring protein precursor [Polystyrenella longa]|uniref:Flagellar L-ring protein n=2 Tax=Polystyrenella longa TaxID=2528007 RepID=A0A518CIT0_9PLAN|nr:Flagellar L-ring protein precursor [Polystyrenella longa]